jgi:hypothetical protein
MTAWKRFEGAGRRSFIFNLKIASRFSQSYAERARF